MSKVLIAEDEPVARTMLRHTLEGGGYEVIAAEDGQEAWRLLNSGQNVHLAVLDWEMPGIDGVEICRKLKEQHQAGFVYVILLTARDGTENITEALQAGAHDYIAKPFNKAELLAHLRVGERLIELQSQLAQSQKMEAIGQLAAGIAHEINTPMQYVGDNIRFLQESFTDMTALLQKHERLLAESKQGSASTEVIGEVEETREEIDIDYLLDEIPQAICQTIEGVERVSEIVRAMKEFSHPGVEGKTPLDINRAIESTLTVARNNWKYIADTDVDFDTELPMVPCLPGEFNQVILNIIVNAAHAIKDATANDTEKDDTEKKGTIGIQTRQNGEDVEIRISDTGAGIPEEIQDKIFDPFFTTKEVGEGSGQGLAISRSIIVDKHNGTLTFETEPGKGTTFIIRLPIDSEQASEPA